MNKRYENKSMEEMSIDGQNKTILCYMNEIKNDHEQMKADHLKIKSDHLLMLKQLQQ